MFCIENSRHILIQTKAYGSGKRTEIIIKIEIKRGREKEKENEIEEIIAKNQIHI